MPGVAWECWTPRRGLETVASRHDCAESLSEPVNLQVPEAEQESWAGARALGTFPGVGRSMAVTALTLQTSLWLQCGEGTEDQRQRHRIGHRSSHTGDGKQQGLTGMEVVTSGLHVLPVGLPCPCHSSAL